jgi:beta-phosphoglucomutase-like phosphatase (HAD superfamily)
MSSIGPFQFPQNGFNAVIFDLDGTLVDSMSAHFEAWCEALALHGASGIFKEDIFHAMGGRPTIDVAVELNDGYNLRLDPAAVAFAKREAFLKRLPGIRLIREVSEFAASLRGKIPMAVASGGTRMVVEKELQIVGISDWFDEVLCAEDVNEGKPSPEVFLKAARLLNVAPADCLALDDAPAGIIAATRAGMQVLGIPSALSSAA